MVWSSSLRGGLWEEKKNREKLEKRRSREEKKSLMRGIVLVLILRGLLVIDAEKKARLTSEAILDSEITMYTKRIFYPEIFLKFGDLRVVASSCWWGLGGKAPLLRSGYFTSKYIEKDSLKKIGKRKWKRKRRVKTKEIGRIKLISRVLHIFTFFFWVLITFQILPKIGSGSEISRLNIHACESYQNHVIKREGLIGWFGKRCVSEGSWLQTPHLH